MDYTVDLGKTALAFLGDQSFERQFQRDATLFYVLEGSFRVRVGDRDTLMREEDILVINPGASCSCRGFPDSLVLEAAIPYELIRHTGRPVFLCNSSAGNTQAYEELRLILKKLMFRHVQNAWDKAEKRKTDFGYVSEYFRMLDLLSSYFALGTSAEAAEGKSEGETRKEAIESYLFENYAEPLSLGDLAQHLALTESYLSRWFRQNYGTTFSSFLRTVRLTRATQELAYTDHAITRIATDNGFMNLSYFTRVFKEEFGKSPQDFRKEQLQQHGDAGTESATARRLENYLQKNMAAMEGQEKGNTFEIRTTGHQPVRPVWRQILNGGRASQLLQGSLQKILRQLVSELGFRYIRFWSIMAPEMMTNAEGGPENLNFRRIDQVIDFILSTGAKPFIDFEEKARRINKTAFQQMLLEETVFEMESEDHLRRMLAALAKHWVRRYGAAELGKWKIEVWYDGVIVQGLQGKENFFSFFKCTYETFKNYAPSMDIGGSGNIPGYVNEASGSRLAFWKAWKQAAPRPDFISLMNFAYESDSLESDYSRRSMDEHYLLHSAEHIRADLEKLDWIGLPLYMTEWNLTVSDRNFLNDACFQGAYIVKNMIEACDRIDMAGYFNACDLLVEYHDSNQLLFGASGLVSANGIFKPAAFAIQFLNMLHSDCCGRGEHFIVTEDHQGSYSIVCHNLRSLNYFYYSTPENEIDRSLVWKCFDDRSPYYMALILKDVENGSYRVRIHRVNESGGSLLDMWARMNYYDYLSEKEVRHLQRQCAPQITSMEKTARDRELSIEIELDANEIALIQIVKTD